MVPLKGPCTESVLRRFALFIKSPDPDLRTTIALSNKLSPPPLSSTNNLVNIRPILPKPKRTISCASSSTDPVLPINSLTESKTKSFI